MAAAIGAFFMVLQSAVAVAAELTCADSSALSERLQAALEPAVVDTVYDGDTLRLRDGRRLRLTGVNAPELPRDGRGGQAQAEAAKRAVTRWLPADGRIYLLKSRSGSDHYGRMLAYVFDAQGSSLEAELLAQGLAFALVVPPDIRHAECYRQIEQLAQAQQKGVWGSNAWRPLSAKEAVARGHTGYVRLSGRVTDIDRGRDTWIELDDALVLKVAAKNDRHFPAGEIDQLLGREVVVRGWLVHRSLSADAKAKGFKAWTMEISSRYAFEAGFIHEN